MPKAKKAGQHSKRRARDEEDDEEEDDDLSDLEDSFKPQPVKRSAVLGEDEDEEDEEEAELERLALEGLRNKGSRPHVNNTAALLQKLEDIKLPDDAWIETLAITPERPVTVENPEDDLGREVAFYEAALAGVKAAQKILDDAQVPFRRPADYFAEMVKSDTHMLKIKNRLLEEKKRIEGAAERRRQRELAKFGKQVQVKREQEKAQQKKKNISDIAKWRKQVGGDKADPEFGISLDHEGGSDQERGRKRPRDSAGSQGSKGGKEGRGAPNAKRRKKDEKYGFGGKKKHAKANTGESAGDTRGFKLKKNNARGDAFMSKKASQGMKQGGGKKKGNTNRPGKSKRQKMRGKGGR
eukprot:tig00000880_g5169.t1